MEKLLDEINKRIEEFEGKPFLVDDFCELSNYENIKKSLQRLALKRHIIRINRGMYYLPHYIPAIDEYSSPEADDIAYALARQNGWTICPSINEAMNLLGVSTQVPMKYEYLTSGPYRKYDISGVEIEFNHASGKYVSPLFSYKTMLVIQAIRGLTKNCLSSEDIIRLRAACSDDDVKLLLDEGRYTNVWIYEEIKKIGASAHV